MSATKRDELVQKALQALHRNGFNATGMDMLVADSPRDQLIAMFDALEASSDYQVASHPTQLTSGSTVRTALSQSSRSRPHAAMVR